MDTTSSQNCYPAQTPADLFADSFDDWIEPKKKLPGETNDSPDATNNTTRWAAWPSVERFDSGSDKKAEVTEREVTERSASTPLGFASRRRVAGLTAFALGALLLIAPLLSSLLQFTLWPRPISASTMPALPTVSQQKQEAWQQVVGENAFQIARAQASQQKRNLNPRQSYALAQKAVLQTINAGGPDYENFAQAEMAGVVDSKLWNLAWNGTLRGGTLPGDTLRGDTLPSQKTMRRAGVIPSRVAPRPGVRMARRIRRPVPQKQAVILGRGPVREDKASIILIRD